MQLASHFFFSGYSFLFCFSIKDQLLQKKERSSEIEHSMHVHSSQIKNPWKFVSPCLKLVPWKVSQQMGMWNSERKKKKFCFPNSASSGGTCKIAKLHLLSRTIIFRDPNFALVQRNNNSTHRRAPFHLASNILRAACFTILRAL